MSRCVCFAVVEAAVVLIMSIAEAEDDDKLLQVVYRLHLPSLCGTVVFTSCFLLILKREDVKTFIGYETRKSRAEKLWNQHPEFDTVDEGRFALLVAKQPMNLNLLAEMENEVCEWLRSKAIEWREQPPRYYTEKWARELEELPPFAAAFQVRTYGPHLPLGRRQELEAPNEDEEDTGAGAQC